MDTIHIIQAAQQKDTTNRHKEIQTSNINRYIHQTEIKTYIKHKSIYTLNINQNIH